MYRCSKCNQNVTVTLAKILLTIRMENMKTEHGNAVA